MNTAGLAQPKPQDLAKADARRVLPPREGSTRIRREVYARDVGVCAQCHLDTDALAREWAQVKAEDDAHFVCNICETENDRRVCACGSKPLTQSLRRQWAFRLRLIAMDFPRKFAERYNGDTFWNANHREGVFEGGGSAGLQNLETLCLRCHAKMTSYQAETREMRRRWR